MSMFTLAISCLTTSNLPWFMDLTFQVPKQYCSLQHQTLLLSPVTSTAGYCFWFGSIPSFPVKLFSFTWRSCSSALPFRFFFGSTCFQPSEYRLRYSALGSWNVKQLLLIVFDKCPGNRTACSESGQIKTGAENGAFQSAVKLFKEW